MMSATASSSDVSDGGQLETWYTIEFLEDLGEKRILKS